MWRPLLFIDNLVDNGVKLCMDWAWYIENDLQIFIFCMIPLFLYKKSKFWSYFLMVWATSISFAYSMKETY